MTRRHSRVAAALVTVCAGTVLCVRTIAQQPQSTQASGSNAPPTGTGIIAGIILSDDGSRPIGRALVMLNGGAINLRPAVLTNSDGAFVFAHLPAGRFTIMASKPGYVTNYYGATRPQTAALALSIVLADSQRITDIKLRLPKGAV